MLEHNPVLYCNGSLQITRMSWWANSTAAVIFSLLAYGFHVWWSDYIVDVFVSFYDILLVIDEHLIAEILLLGLLWLLLFKKRIHCIFSAYCKYILMKSERVCSASKYKCVSSHRQQYCCPCTFYVLFLLTLCMCKFFEVLVWLKWT